MKTFLDFGRRFLNNLFGNKEFFNVRNKDIINFQKKIGYVFSDADLLKQALTHSSFAGENNTKDNERLEFLGDGILGAIIGSYLFELFPDLDEGHLTKSRAKIVNETNLFNVAKKYNVGKYLRLGRGEELSGGRDRPSILSDTLEAVIGAIFLDSDYEMTEKVVLDIFEGSLEGMLGYENFKGKLQELCEKRLRQKPYYELLEQEGLAHQKIFTVGVLVNGKMISQAKGNTKKQAEQTAAKCALNNLINISEGEL